VVGDRRRDEDLRARLALDEDVADKGTLDARAEASAEEVAVVRRVEEEVSGTLFWVVVGN
jgi:hypothetical protein